MTELSVNAGPVRPTIDPKVWRLRNIGVELLATAALAVSLAVAATAVSMGMARAHVLHVDYFSALTSHAVSLAHLAGGDWRPQ